MKKFDVVLWDYKALHQITGITKKFGNYEMICVSTMSYFILFIIVDRYNCFSSKKERKIAGFVCSKWPLSARCGFNLVRIQSGKGGGYWGRVKFFNLQK